MDLQIPFLVLSQVDRGSVKGEGKIGLHSAKESGDIENDADVLMWIEGGALSRDMDTAVEIHVGKQREGPAGFSIPMVFHPLTQTFEEARVESE
jgi:replicative DNA helicase